MSRVRLLAALLLTLLSLRAGATSFMVRPFSETIHSTDTIVRGILGPSYANWVEVQPDDKRIFTFYELEISEVVKGRVPEGRSLVFRQVGGTRDGIGMDVAGTAHFAQGEDVVVMLGARNDDGSYDLGNLMLGKLTVTRDAETGEEKLAGPALHEPGIFLGHDGTGPEKTAKEPWTMERLREVVKEQGDAPKRLESKEKAVTHPPSPPAPGGTPTPAPPLQPQGSSAGPHEGESGPGRFSRGALALAVLAFLAGILFLFWGSRRGR
ncbi:MAG TPA: hypothetical protein VL588_08565 [Bdellovibrionota bacterium]|jgi:hypothetical protein|nr:hypothetical protein [Bdellovibrionota bacterium]